MRSRSRSLAVFFSLALLVVACGAAGGAPTPSPTLAPVGGYPGWSTSAGSDLIPVPVSTELVVGPNRVLVNVIDQANNSIATADQAVQFLLYDLAQDPATPKIDVQGTYLPTIQGLPGLYRLNATFDTAGDWGIEAIATIGGVQHSGRLGFPVEQSGSTPAIGAAAPISPTPTATTAAQIATISSDSSPDPDFYTTSEPDALTAHDPFVLVFATPAFCRSAMCGPTLNTVKSAAADYKGRLTFINVEPYKLQTVAGALQPVLDENNLPIPVDATNIWGLPTEPYIFVVNSDGKVTAKFEGIVGADELHAAFDAALN